jgi:hypothetical protein
MNTNKKTGIIGVLNNPSTSINHHSSGAVHIVKELFDAIVLTHNDNWDNYDELIIYHGPNFKKGVYNIIGGINEEVLTRSEKLNKCKSKIYTLDGFQLNEFSVKRNINQYNNTKSFESIDLPERNNIVIGDSHSLSVWPNKSYTIKRIDGKTLYGFLKDPMKLDNYSNSILYFGNIDIRFHLCRQIDPIYSANELMQRYCEFASKNNSTIVNLLPIENEDRIIPKSGMYKNKPFFGSRELRSQLVIQCNEIMNTSGLNTIKWPSFFVDNNNILKQNILEPKQSVHIRPKYYQRIVKHNLI